MTGASGTWGFVCGRSDGCRPVIADAVTSTVLQRTDDPERCWCGAVECDDSRHCACGLADCAGHPAPFGDPL